MIVFQQRKKQAIACAVLKAAETRADIKNKLSVVQVRPAVNVKTNVGEPIQPTHKLVHVINCTNSF